MDVDRSIRVAVDTGDVTLGSEKSIQSLKLGKGQRVIVAANTPKDIVEDVIKDLILSNSFKIFAIEPTEDGIDDIFKSKTLSKIKEDAIISVFLPAVSKKYVLKNFNTTSIP